MDLTISMLIGKNNVDSLMAKGDVFFYFVVVVLLHQLNKRLNTISGPV
jgi:hypothetical protein